jgi:hypothetical protein
VRPAGAGDVGGELEPRGRGLEPGGVLIQRPPGRAEAGSGGVVKDAGCLLERGRALREQPRAVRLAGERGARIVGTVGGELAVQVLQRQLVPRSRTGRPRPPASQDHFAAPSPGGSASRQPIPHTLTISRCPPGRYSFWRSRAAWLSTVRDRDADG